jgi:hypothetical protein
VVLLAGCDLFGGGGGDGGTITIRDNGTCVFSGAVSGSHPCTVGAAFTLSQRVGLVELSYNTAADYPDGGVVGYTFYATVGFPADPVAGTYTLTDARVIPGYIQASVVYPGVRAWSLDPDGGFTLVLDSVEYLGVDPEIGRVFRPRGSFEAALLPDAPPASGQVRVQATF